MQRKNFIKFAVPSGGHSQTDNNVHEIAIKAADVDHVERLGENKAIIVTKTGQFIEVTDGFNSVILQLWQGQ